MKFRLLDLLVCPKCGNSFDCEVFAQHTEEHTIPKTEHPICHSRCAFSEYQQRGESPNPQLCVTCFQLEIDDGLLRCNGCDEIFPIIKGVPRILLERLRQILWKDYPEYIETYKNQLSETSCLQMPSDVEEKRFLKAKEKTSESFGFEWTHFNTMYNEWERNFQGYFAPKDSSFFEGKLILDAGCGTGRHLYYASMYGEEAVGMDLSKAVDIAYQNTRQFPQAHLIQADLYNLPFHHESFDFVYSIGVLHHLPTPEEGFRKLLDYLRRGGEIRIYLYWNLENEPKWKQFLLEIVTAIRKVTTKMPHPVLYHLSYLIAGIAYLTFVIPYKLLSKLAISHQFAETLPLKSYANYPFGVCHNDQFDRFSAPIENRYNQKEIKAWLERAGLEDISVTPHFGWLGHGRKPDE